MTHRPTWNCRNSCQQSLRSGCSNKAPQAWQYSPSLSLGRCAPQHWKPGCVQQKGQCCVTAMGRLRVCPCDAQGWPLSLHSFGAHLLWRTREHDRGLQMLTRPGPTVLELFFKGAHGARYGSHHIHCLPAALQASVGEAGEMCSPTKRGLGSGWPGHPEGLVPHSVMRASPTSSLSLRSLPCNMGVAASAHRCEERRPDVASSDLSHI